MFLARVSVCVFIASALGCSSGSSAGSGGGSATATGSVGGQSLAVSHAAAVHSTQFAPSMDGWAIYLGDQSVACTGDPKHPVASDLTPSLYLEVDDTFLGGTASPISPGTYTVTGLTGSDAGLGGESRSGLAMIVGGADGGGDIATSGTITITGLSTQHIAGTYDVVFPDGELKGTFDAPLCTTVPPLDAGGD
jgi:hypothetical protein